MAFFIQFDTDGSGQIEFPEFCNMMAVKMNEDSTDEELIRIAFRVLDRKGSGKIASKEFKNLMTNIGDKLSEAEVRKKPPFNEESFLRRFRAVRHADRGGRQGRRRQLRLRGVRPTHEPGRLTEENTEKTTTL